MTREPVPTIRSRRLAAILREMRKASGLSYAAAAARAGVDESTVRRSEQRNARTAPNNAWRLAHVYGAGEADLERVTALARDAGRPGWWQEYDLPFQYATFVAFEAEAASKMAWEPSLFPGLLQTAGYARAVIAAGPGRLPAGDVDRLARVRAERQKALVREDPLRLHAVVDEAALRRIIGGPDLMRAQLRHVAGAAEAENVTVQVLPFRAGAHPAPTGPFAILCYPGEPDVLYEEGLVGAVYAEEPADLERGRRVFDDLTALALSPRETMSLLAEVASGL